MKKILKTTGRIAAASLAIALAVPTAWGLTAQAETKTFATNVQQATAAQTQIVPFRDIAEAAGAEVLWNDDEKTATATRGQTTIAAKIGESSIAVNGKTIALAKPVQLANEKTVVPLDALNEALGIKAGWDEQAQSIVADKDDYPLLASAFISAWKNGDTAKARSYMNDSLQSLMPNELLQQFWANLTQMYGPLGAQLVSGQSSNPVHHNATSVYKTAAGALEMTVRFDTYGKVDDLYVPISPANNGYTKPSYDDPSKYTERDVVIGEGLLALPGTLTLPAGKGPFPVVVLVHGSGPNDRDESIGAAKTFRDLAVGLASQGVAVLRYEKITREYPLRSALGIAPFTLQEETVDDAVRAVELLQHTEGIDPDRIYVAGHSQGGMAVPRIVDSAPEGSIAGAIVLAGPSRPLEDLLVEQMKFQLEVARKAGKPTEAIEQQIAMYEQQFKLIKDPQYSIANPPQGFILGDTAWWLDIRNMYAAEDAKDQNVPMLVIQGDNDAQVFPDNLDGWKTALSARTNVQYKLYPKINHTLVEYDGQSTGAEYNAPANVPDYLIADIAKWIKP